MVLIFLGFWGTEDPVCKYDHRTEKYSVEISAIKTGLVVHFKIVCLIYVDESMCMYNIIIVIICSGGFSFSPESRDHEHVFEINDIFMSTDYCNGYI